MRIKFFKTLQVVSFIFLFSNLYSATYRNYISHEIIGGTTLKIWIDSDTALGETALAEVRYDDGAGGYIYTGITSGTYDDLMQPGANWYVELTIPMGTNTVDYQLATKNQSGTNYGFTGFGSTLTGLPVKLLFFRGKVNNSNHFLTWKTASETNNSHFNIQHSTNNKTWTNIGQVKGRGTSDQLQTYNFEDNKPHTGKNSYRLEQVDFDGTSAYSSIVFLHRERYDIGISPNPARDFIVIELPSFNDPEQCTILLTNSSGQVVSKSPGKDSTVRVEMKKLVAGLYTVTILDKTGHIMISKRLCKL